MATSAVRPHRHATRRRPTARPPALRHLGPNWYASVMGTAIVANAGAALPVHVPGLRTACAGRLGAVRSPCSPSLLAARAAHWRHHRDQARAHLLDPAVGPLLRLPRRWRCWPSAAAPSSSAGTVIGTGGRVAVDAVLFTAGTVLAARAAVAVPVPDGRTPRVEPAQATPVWLLPVVAPMVSAALGPLLVPHLPAGQPREALLLGLLRHVRRSACSRPC